MIGSNLIGLNLLPFKEKSITTPSGLLFKGLEFDAKICGVSVMRAGESMEKALRECCQGTRLGKILIQKEENVHRVFYAKMPADISQRYCLVLEPVLETGRTATLTIQVHDLLYSQASERQKCSRGENHILVHFGNSRGHFYDILFFPACQNYMQ